MARMAGAQQQARAGRRRFGGVRTSLETETLGHLNLGTAPPKQTYLSLFVGYDAGVTPHRSDDVEAGRAREVTGRR
jgi:hypothetical protein